MIKRDRGGEGGGERKATIPEDGVMSASQNTQIRKFARHNALNDASFYLCR